MYIYIYIYTGCISCISNASIHDMRHLYTWNEAFMCIKWGNLYISVCPYICICTGRISYLLNAYTHKWGIYTYETRHLYMKWGICTYEAFMYIKWGNSYISVCPYIYICTGRISYLWNAYMHKMRHLYIWNEAFMYVKWGIYTNEMRRSCMWNEAFIQMKWGIHVYKKRLFIYIRVPIYTYVQDAFHIY